MVNRSRVGVFLAVAVLFSLSHAALAASFTYSRMTSPSRTVVTDASGQWVATLTDRARTVTLSGPQRLLKQTGVNATVVSHTWVRLLPAAFDPVAGLDENWIHAELADTTPDVLAIAMQYVTGAHDRHDSHGARIAGDAMYGPPLPHGDRVEGADFFDFLDRPWSFGGVTIAPDPLLIGALDCSGFVRTVFGFRGKMPLARSHDSAGGTSLPRRAIDLYASAPGTVLFHDAGHAPSTARVGKLSPGDLVFFDADGSAGIDHVGIYLGTDSTGKRRFVSSRKTDDGPTIGDAGGSSTVGDDGYYGRAFRAARRL